MLLLRTNLNMIHHLSNMGSDFDDSDYEILSTLDSSNVLPNNERIHFMISQLPTFQYEGKSRVNTDEGEGLKQTTDDY